MQLREIACVFSAALHYEGFTQLFGDRKRNPSRSFVFIDFLHDVSQESARGAV